MHHRYFFRYLIAFLVGWTAWPSHRVAAEQPAVGVTLNTPQVWRQPGQAFPDGKERWGSPLSMELTRQAILIAARDELGLRTLDASLGEPDELPGFEALVLDLDMIAREGSKIRLRVGGELVLDHMLPTDWFVHPEQPRTVLRHARFAQAQAVEALKQAGLEGEPNRWLDTAPVPEPIMELADELTLIAQFRAARALHQLIREEGESPERLWTLSRVYANLGQESRWFIRCQFAVFQARSLLYAQRVWLKSPEHPLSQLSMAYAWTMATYTRHALTELGKFDQKGEAGEPWARWARLVRACCEYDQEALNAFMTDQGPQAPVAALWGVVTNQFIGLKGLTFKAIDAAMDVNPMSTRNLYGGYDAMGVSAGHWLTEAAPEHFGLITAVQLARVQDAPEALVPHLPRPAQDVEPLSLKQLAETAWAMQDLAAEGKDPQELGYGVLGTLIDEANALHVLYRAKFMRRQWGVDTAAYLRATAPALGRHPFRPLIVTFLYPSRSTHDGMKELMAQFEPTYINPVNLAVLTYQLPNVLTYADGMTQLQWWRLATGMDWMSGTDWLCGMRWYYGDNLHLRGRYAGNMGAYDPHHPKRIALRIQHAKLKDQKIEQHIRDYGNHAIVADALAGHMLEKGNLPQAREYAGLAALAAPERQTLERLARVELLLGDEARWLAAMKVILRQPDHGLDHARVNQTIAHTYMNQGRFEDALPYAKESADSWAAWAMNTYIINLAALGQHDEARAIGRRVNERYGMDYLSEQSVQMWAGHDNPGVLIGWLQQYYKQRHGERSEYNWRMVYAEMALGQYEEALKRVEGVVSEAEPSTRVLLFGVVAAQHLGKDAKRDQLLKMLIEYPLDNGKRYRFSLLGDLMKQGLETGRIDWDAAAKWTREHDRYGIEVAGNLAFFALKLPGEKERALSELMALAKRPEHGSDMTNIARTLLRGLGYSNEQMLPTGFNGHALPRNGVD